MPIHTLDDAPIVSGDVMLPGRGLWTGDLLISTETVPAVGASVALTLAGVTRRGAVVHAGAEYMQARVRIVGGAGKLGTVIEPRDYRGYSAQRIAEDIIKDAGEGIGSGWSELSAWCAHWTRTRLPAREALWRIMRKADVGLRWRVSTDGKLSLYRDSYATIADEAVGEQVAIWPHDRMARVAPETGALEPGVGATIFDTVRRVDRVLFAIRPDGLRADVWYL